MNISRKSFLRSALGSLAAIAMGRDVKAEAKPSATAVAPGIDGWMRIRLLVANLQIRDIIDPISGSQVHPITQISIKTTDTDGILWGEMRMEDFTADPFAITIGDAIPQFSTVPFHVVALGNGYMDIDAPVESYSPHKMWGEVYKGDGHVFIRPIGYENDPEWKRRQGAVHSHQQVNAMELAMQQRRSA